MVGVVVLSSVTGVAHGVNETSVYKDIAMLLGVKYQVLDSQTFSFLLLFRLHKQLQIA